MSQESRSGTYSRRFESSQQAIQEVARLAVESGSSWVFVSDLDDTLLASFSALIQTLNDTISASDPTWLPLGMREVSETPTGRIEDTRARRHLLAQGIAFEKLWGEICAKPETYMSMPLLPGVLDLLSELSRLGVPLVGYLTARPKEVYEATDINLDRNQLPTVPIFGPENPNGNIAEDKVKLLSQLLDLLPKTIKVLYADDHVGTCEYAKSYFGDRVEVICVASPRNQRAREKTNITLEYGDLYFHTANIRYQLTGE